MRGRCPRLDLGLGRPLFLGSDLARAQKEDLVCLRFLIGRCPRLDLGLGRPFGWTLGLVRFFVHGWIAGGCKGHFLNAIVEYFYYTHLIYIDLTKGVCYNMYDKKYVYF